MNEQRWYTTGDEEMKRAVGEVGRGPSGCVYFFCFILLLIAAFALWKFLVH